MKVTPVTDLFLQLDSLHKRIDLQRITAHVLALIVAAWWAVAGDAHDARGLALRFIAGVFFMVLARLLLSRLGTSRLSALLFSGLLLVLSASFSVSELMVVNVYAMVVLLAQEYFILRGKFVALAVAVLAGVVSRGPVSGSLGHCSWIVNRGNVSHR